MSKPESVYPVVDLFAGPGGLGEGFAEVLTNGVSPTFKSVVSIEREQYAYQTLLLRHFFRLFRFKDVPDDYYDYLSSRISKEELIAKNGEHWIEAKASVSNISLGEKNRDRVKRLIKKKLQGKKKWALIGGPPCQAYSLAGRSRMMGNPDFEEDERHLLYREYLRVIIDHKPPVFVMENVKGLLSARINDRLAIDKIIKELSSPKKATKGNCSSLNYKLFSLSSSGEISDFFEPKSFIVRAEEYGVPQARHRMFILGN